MRPPSLEGVMLTSPSCKWYDHDGETLAANASHYMVDKQHPTHPAVLVVVRRHVESPFGIADKEWIDLRGLARTWLSRHEPEGLTFGWNVGAAGGQDVFHAHMHVTCRFAGEGAGRTGLARFYPETSLARSACCIARINPNITIARQLSVAQIASDAGMPI